jgi:hypothetical protein
MSTDETPEAAGSEASAAPIPAGPSGSRWEPTEPVAAPVPAPDRPAEDRALTATPPRRHRLALAAAALGIAGVAGLGGFAVGHAAAGEPTRNDFFGSDVGRDGTPPDFDGDGDHGQPPGLPGEAPDLHDGAEDSGGADT